MAITTDCFHVVSVGQEHGLILVSGEQRVGDAKEAGGLCPSLASDGSV